MARGPENKEGALKSGADEPIEAPTPSVRAPPRSIRYPSIAPGLERVLTLEGSVVATNGNVFFQIRRGHLTVDSIERICAASLRHRTSLPRGALQGIIALTEPGAPIAAEPARIRQRTVVNEMLKYPNLRMAVVIFGEDVTASMLRAASRGVAPTSPQQRLFDRPEAACTWMSAELGINQDELLAALSQARAVAARELGGATP